MEQSPLKCIDCGVDIGFVASNLCGKCLEPLSDRDIKKRIEALEARQNQPCPFPHYPCTLPHYQTPPTYTTPNTWPPSVTVTC